MKFCTAINCMDGRAQLPVIDYLRKRFNAEYVDVITEPGPNLIMAEATNQVALDRIFLRLNISIDNHNSVGVAVVGHHDCAGNPSPRDAQIDHIRKAIALLRERCKGIEIIGLWVDADWMVHEVDLDPSRSSF